MNSTLIPDCNRTCMQHRQHSGLSRPSGCSLVPFRCQHTSPAAKQVIRVQAGPEKTSVAALEAAIGAINGILGAHSKVRRQQQKQQQGTANKQPRNGTGALSASSGPSKLISFSAQASTSVPVKETLPLSTLADQESHSSSHSSSHRSSCSEEQHEAHQHDRNNGHQGHPHKSHHHQHTNRGHHHQEAQHQHQHQQQQQQHPSSKQPSWLQSLTGKQAHSSSSSSKAAPPPAEAWSRSVQAYLSLPLEQYSVLDPRLITRLPPGTDIEALLTKLLAARKQSRAEKRQQQQEAAAGSAGGSNGTSLQPQMRQLELTDESSAPKDESSGPLAQGDHQLNGHTSEPSSSSNGVSVVPTSNGAENHPSSSAAPVAAGAEEVLNGSSSSNGDSSSVEDTAAAEAAAAEGVVAPGEAGGAFLLRIPMEELLGIDLEPLLVITVDIDSKHGQVKFHASRLVIGDERFDSEFKVDLLATMSSRITKQPALVQPAAVADHDAKPEAAAAAVTSTSSSSSSSSSSVAVPSSSSSNTSTSTGTSTSAAAVAVAVAPEADLAAAALATSSTTATAEQQQQQQQQPYWNRTSALSCKVKLSMTLRLPHPLSIVPGPLLSTTASLVAKLVMQSLLPSFLELLATDYGRWASGSSRAAPVGSLVAAGKQHLQQMPSAQQ